MKWISVKDKLPDNKKLPYVIALHDGYYPVIYHNEKTTPLSEETLSKTKPTHWMPLPKPPEVID